jgi:hypothetical protein
MYEQLRQCCDQTIVDDRVTKLNRLTSCSASSCSQVFSGSILRTVVLPPSTAPEHLWCPPHRSCHLPWGKAECMHASITCLLLYEDYVWVSLGNAMKAKQSKATRRYMVGTYLAEVHRVQNLQLTTLRHTHTTMPVVVLTRSIVWRIGQPGTPWQLQNRARCLESRDTLLSCMMALPRHQEPRN